MTFTEIANELVAGCREGRERKNLHKLYAPDAVSVEAADFGMGTTSAGLAAINGKHDWWEQSFSVHSADVAGPFPHGQEKFAVIFDTDVTEKASGQRMQMRSIGVYHVKDGKIVREEFFYAS
jgi:ketosteroid isomerase-like protein